MLELNINSDNLETVLRQLYTNSSTGLSSSEAASRQIKYGTNELDLNPPESLVSKFAEQFQNPLILLLLASAGISVLIGHIGDAISIAVTILIVLTGTTKFERMENVNNLISSNLVAFVQEYKSSQSIEALNKLAPPHCHVIRDGHTTDTLAANLVPGDIIRFSRGDRIPADARIILSSVLEVDESTLT